MDRFFQILAVVFGGAAAYFLWMGMKDQAFAAIVLVCSAFLLSVRFQAKARNEERKAEQTSKTAAEQ